MTESKLTVQTDDLVVVDGVVRAASFAKLIECVTSSDIRLGTAFNPHLASLMHFSHGIELTLFTLEIDEVLLTYRAFDTAVTLVETLISRFEKPTMVDPEVIKAMRLRYFHTLILSFIPLLAFL